MLKRFTLSLAALLAALAVTPVALGAVGDSAAGTGSTVWTTSFSFSATDGPGLTATGQMHAVDGGESWTASVRCLLVEGNRAVVVGTVTAATGPMAWSYIGDGLIFHTTDGGTPGVGVDGAYMYFSDGPMPCESFAFNVLYGTRAPLTAGEIVIADGLADADFDEVTDALDNCPTRANPGQENLDHDALGDACDATDDRTAAELLADLIADLQGGSVGPGNSYLAKLQAIAASIDSGDVNATCNQLAAFENEVRAQTGKKLAEEDAQVLLNEAAAIRAKVPCA